MKLKHLFVLAAAAAVTLAACKKEDSKSYIFRVSPSEVQFEAAGGSEPLYVVTTGSWTVSGASLFSLDRTSGKGPGTVVVTAAKATADDPVEETLVFTCGDKTAKVTVRQKGALSPEDAISVDPTSLAFEEEEGSKEVTVTATGEYTASSEVDWISTAINGNKTTVTVAQNSGTERTSTITFTCGSKTATVTVTQAKAGPVTKIKTAQDFLAFLDQFKQYPDGTVVEFACDVDFAGVTGIPYADFPASLTLDGKGFAIKNWVNAGVPMFKTNNGTLQNIVIDGSCTITYNISLGSKTQFGILCAQNVGLIKGCTNKAGMNLGDFTVSATTHYGFFTGINRNAVEDCVNEGNLVITTLTGPASGQFRFGFFVGSLAENASTKTLKTANCVNKGSITVTKADNKNANFGGIVGYYDSKEDAEVTGCVNEGNLSVSATVETTALNVGGIAGNLLGGMISSCSNLGSVSSAYAAGGIAGAMLKGSKISEYKTLEGCEVHAEVSGEGSASGLVFGTSTKDVKFTLGSEAAPIKVSGKVNGTAVTADNMISFLHGSGVSAGAGSNIFAQYEAKK